MNWLKLKRIIKGVLFDKDRRFLYLAKAGLYNWMSDEEYIMRRFKALMGYEFDMDNPKTFNEKLQWLKLHDRNPLYTTLVDKYEVKKYVADIIGEEYIIQTLGVWERFEDIDFDTLPNQFVLKCTHDSGSCVIVKDKGNINKKAIKKKLNHALKENFYYTGREWPYKNVKPRIIAEKYMTDNGNELSDYKFMCFNGKVCCSFVCSERQSESGLKVTFYDEKWDVMPFERHYPKSNQPTAKPKNYEKMVELSEKLANNIPFVRVDFYDIMGQIYFGELTFYPGNGCEEFRPFEWDKLLGEWIELRAYK